MPLHQVLLGGASSAVSDSTASGYFEVSPWFALESVVQGDYHMRVRVSFRNR